jgi:hypothetical protein
MSAPSLIIFRYFSDNSSNDPVSSPVSAYERYPVSGIRKELFQILRTFNIQSMQGIIAGVFLTSASDSTKESNN